MMMNSPLESLKARSWHLIPYYKTSRMTMRLLLMLTHVIWMDSLAYKFGSSWRHPLNLETLKGVTTNRRWKKERTIPAIAKFGLGWEPRSSFVAWWIHVCHFNPRLPMIKSLAHISFWFVPEISINRFQSPILSRFPAHPSGLIFFFAQLPLFWQETMQIYEPQSWCSTLLNFIFSNLARKMDLAHCLKSRQNVGYVNEDQLNSGVPLVTSFFWQWIVGM